MNAKPYVAVWCKKSLQALLPTLPTLALYIRTILSQELCTINM